MSKPPPPKFSRSDTIDITRNTLFANVANGVKCPCCDQFCKVYRRKLNSGMMHALIQIATVQNKIDKELLPQGTKIWIDISKISLRGGDYGKLRWWNILEQRQLRKDEKESGEKSGSARWRVTPEGIQFLTGERVVPKFVFLYNNKVNGFSEETITAPEALGDKFNFGELMKPFFAYLEAK